MDGGHTIGLDGTGTGIGPRGASPLPHAGTAMMQRPDAVIGAIHSQAANLLMLSVALHVARIVMAKRPLAQFMLFPPWR